MIYPRLIKKGDTIGVCAPSHSACDILDQKRFDNANLKLKKYGYQVIETSNVRKALNNKQDNIIKAHELESLFLNDNISYIICAKGGELLVELLDEINFNIIKKHPKWLQGYSDPTALLYTITTNFDIATVYGYNFGAYGMQKWHPSINNGLQLLEGLTNEQKSYTYYQESHNDYVTGLEGFLREKKVKWKNLRHEETITMQGRIIGGCLDVILNIIGTKYDHTTNFINKYKNDGIIWYFDNFSYPLEGIIRAIWQFKNAGYFKYCKGVIFGRNNTLESCYNISLEEALNRAFDGMNFPVIYDADIGHKKPTMTIINGAIATITSKNGEGFITQEFI